MSYEFYLYFIREMYNTFKRKTSVLHAIHYSVGVLMPRLNHAQPLLRVSQWQAQPGKQKM